MRSRMALLTVCFTGYPREALALKRALPEFANVSSVTLAAKVSARSLELGPYNAREAAEKAACLEREGLLVAVNAFVRDGYSLVDERGPSIWLIEDPVENRRVIADAIRRGVRVVESQET
jgi:hypothetical protein